MDKVVVPLQKEGVEGPVIFLGGPIQGAYDWQATAIDYFLANHDSVMIASPKRARWSNEEDVTSQYAWETQWLRRAGQNGVVLFWLSKEAHHICERAYAQTSRFELAEWKVRHERDGAKLAIGIENGFSNATYITNRFKWDCPEIEIQNNLEDTCRLALNLL